MGRVKRLRKRTTQTKTKRIGKINLDKPNGDKALKNKPPSYCRGWNKVKYREML